MPWGYAAAAVGSAVIGSKSASESSRATGRASKRSIAEQRRQFDLSRADRAPYRAAGRGALTSLQDMMGLDAENPYEAGTPESNAFESRQKYDFKESPGYQFRLDQGMQALDRSQAGRRLGGRAAKEALRYGQDYGSGEFGKQFSRLSTIAGYGPSAFDSGGPSGVPGTMESAGANRANAAIMGGTAVNDAIQGGLSNYMTYQQYNQQPNYNVPGDAYMPAAQYGG